MTQTISDQSILAFRILYFSLIPIPWLTLRAKQSQVREILAALSSFVSCTLNMSTHSHLNGGKIASLGIQAKQKPEGSTAVCPLVAR